MAAGLSRKAELLLAVLIRRGGGIVDEYLLRDGTGMSHGSIVAARRELVAGGWLQLGKKERKLVYVLTGQGGKIPPQSAGARAAGTPSPLPEPRRTAAGVGLVSEIASRRTTTGAGMGTVDAEPARLDNHPQLQPESPAGDLEPAASGAATAVQTAAAGTTADGSRPQPAPADRAVSQPPSSVPVPIDDSELEDEDTSFARLIEPMEHVTGHFGSFDEWTDVLIDTLGGNIDITESLVEDGAYQIHSYDHDCDDCYQVTATDDGILVE